ATGTITVTVEDGQGGSDVRPFSVAAEAESVNTPPFLGPIADVVTAVNTPVQITLPAVDVDGGFPAFDADAAHATVTVAGNVVTVTPDEGYTGPIDLLVGVRDPSIPVSPVAGISQVYDLQYIRIAVGDAAIEATASAVSVNARMGTT